MKRRNVVIMAAIAAVAAAGVVAAQTWHAANQITFAWDPVDRIMTTDTIKYQVYLRRAEQGASLIASGGEITATTATVTFQQEGRYYLCVQALRYPAGETQPVKSEISCSDNAAVVRDGAPFGAVYYLPPAAPQGLRLGG